MAYTVDELADTVGVSVPTVRNWIAAGMQRLDDNRPTIIMGFQALDYLNGRKAKAARPLALGEFYCCRCKTPRAAFGAMADYVPTSATGGSLKTLCSLCDCACNRTISADELDDFATVLDITTQHNSDAC